jgi:hypothetical protein
MADARRGDPDPEDAPPPSVRPDEDPKARLDRELIELLNELRVALPGVQVLFAFLLILPFTDGFAKLTGPQRNVYFATFLCAALAVALLIAPSSYHRLRFRHHDKERMLRISNRLVIVGMAFVALAVTGVVFLISDLLFGKTWAALATAGVAGWFAWFWYGLPLTRPDPGDEGAAPPR